jgi:hypothetical protein
MRFLRKSLIAILLVGGTFMLCTAGARAQNMTIRGSETISLRGGESQEEGDFYYVANCISLLKNPPLVEIVQGPPGVTAEMKEAMVLAREQKCPAPVKGYKLFVAVKQPVEDPSYSPLIVRITYDTREGERRQSLVYNLYLVP